MFRPFSYLLILSLLLPLGQPIALHASISQSKEEYSILPVQKLFSIPQRKGTVGTLLFCRKRGILYVLLGREDIAGPTTKAGQYCDLGGSINLNGTTIADNMLRELQEESAGAFYLTLDQLKSSIVLYKKTGTNRDIYYALYLLPPSHFLSTAALEKKREQAKKEGLPQSYVEKDKFLWVHTEDLLKSFKENRSSYWMKVKDINRKTHHIRLRKFFVEDCLSHPYFDSSIKKLEFPLK